MTNDLWVEMKYPTIHDYAKQGSESNNPHEIYASGIEKMYNDEDVWDSATTTKEELVEFIGNLPKNEFIKIRKFFETMPSVTHTVKLKNPKTGYEFPYTFLE